MKHIKSVSLKRRPVPLVRAEAKQDFIISLYRDVVDFYYAKMTAVTGGGGGTSGGAAA